MDELTLTIDDRIATVTLNRAERHNAINLAMWQAIPALCARLAHDSSIHVVIWQGAGHAAFCAGFDIAEFARIRSDRRQTRFYNQQVQAALDAMLVLEKPVLALIRGYCFGGGMFIARHCDLRYATPDARFSIPVAKLGAVLTYGQLQRLVDLTGFSATLDLLLTARHMTAQEALQCGLCNQLFAPGEIDEAVTCLARQMAQLSPMSQNIHKRMMRQLLRHPNLRTLPPEEWDAVEKAFDHPDYAEGTRAFIEKRPPRFEID